MSFFIPSERQDNVGPLTQGLTQSIGSRNGEKARGGRVTGEGLWAGGREAARQLASLQIPLRDVFRKQERRTG